MIDYEREATDIQVERLAQQAAATPSFQTVAPQVAIRTDLNIIQKDEAQVARRAIFDFQTGSNTTLSVSDDPVGSRVLVKYNASAPAGAALTETDDTNVTLTLGGSPTTALLAATSLTLGWTGTLSTARGGVDLTAWSSWTPTWTNLTVGNGTVVAKYKQIGKTTFCRVSLVFGTTTSISGDVTLTLPVTKVSYGGSDIATLGMVRCFDVSAGAAFEGPILTAGTTTGRVRVFGVSGTNITTVALGATVPFTWTNPDEIAIEFFYEAA